MFDYIHTGDRCGQTKAFDCHLDNLRPGDAVNRADSQYAMHEGGWLIVRSGRIDGWFTEPDPDLPRYDNTANRLAGELPNGYHYKPRTREDTAEVAGRLRKLADIAGEPTDGEVDELLEGRNAVAQGVPHGCSICDELRSEETHR